MASESFFQIEAGTRGGTQSKTDLQGQIRIAENGMELKNTCNALTFKT